MPQALFTSVQGGLIEDESIFNIITAVTHHGHHSVLSRGDLVKLDQVNSLQQRQQLSSRWTFHKHFNSLAPGEFDYSLKLVNFLLQSQISKFQIHFNDKYLMYFWSNYYQVSATTPHWSLVNIGTGNGLVPSGNVDLCWPRPCRHMTSLGHNELNSHNCNFVNILFVLISILMTKSGHNFPLVMTA